ncbi:MAG TPA: tetratricopeptide repeat protein [Micropepsaceae bacterium]
MSCDRADLRASDWSRKRRRLPQLLLLFPVLGLLAACMMKPASVPPPMMAMIEPPPQQGPASIVLPVLQPTPGLAARERFQLAINQLQQGDSAHAAVELRAYLAEIPNSVPAKTLLSQIETPIDMLYPADNFTIQLGRDETLSSLAGLYLGDVLGFYGLARYNMIDNPSRLVIGQSIRIPRTPQTLAAQAMRGTLQQASATPPLAGATANAPPRATILRDPWPTIRQAVAQGRFDDAIKEAETRKVRPDTAQAAVLAAAYAGNARALRMANAPQAGTQALRAGQLYLENANRPEDALEPLRLAIAINPADARAQMLLTTAKTKAADIHYRAGVAAFQKQDLDGAIAAWDKTLAIDPDHKNAQLNRAQAVELKQNLQKLR